YKLGQKKPFFYRLVEDLAGVMGDAYPELTREADRVAQVLKTEEERFGETIEHGMKILDESMSTLKPGATLSGDTVFLLYDTFGFPPDLTADICREKKIIIDEEGFNRAMEAQRTRARMASQFKALKTIPYSGHKTRFDGYDLLTETAEVVALYKEGVAVEVLQPKETGLVILNQTPFYGESGGQAGDSGSLVSDTLFFEVQDTQKIQPEVMGHIGVVTKGQIKVGDQVTASVNETLRAQTMRNHSATHLMHKALREVLGTHVQQKGSLVNADRTRFDFSHHQPMTDDEIARVEAIVNREILTNTESTARVMSYDDAIKTGAMALFGEKYGDSVRVLNIGTSCELCGGTHIKRTGDIGLFKIVAESGVASGVRRVEAVTGLGVMDYLNTRNGWIARVAGELKTAPEEIGERVTRLIESARAGEKEIARLKARLVSHEIRDAVENHTRVINGIKTFVYKLVGVDNAVLREALDKARDLIQSGVLVLATENEGKVQLVVGVTKDQTARVKANEIAASLAQMVGGKGGGKPDMAQAGGSEVDKLDQALLSVEKLLSNTK
ncbi:MAG: alanine--tRNA ligase, partial [Burkholderiales bacterium]|nr:alanine--tRNA ligase [Burkholderiales bacterium]